MNEPLSEDLAHELYRFGDEIRPLRHADAMVASCYAISRKGRPTALAKVQSRPEDLDRESYCLAHLSGILPVPRVLDHMSAYRTLVLEWCPGHLLEQEQITERLAHRLGECLAILHQERAAYFGDPAFASTGQESPLPGLEQKFHEELEECWGVLQPAEIQACLELFEREKPRLAHVDGPCLIHRDFRPGNVLVENGVLVAIIDWASARFGFAEQDLVQWDMGEWCTASRLKKAFYAGYASVRPVPQTESVQKLLSMVRALGLCGFMAKTGHHRGVGRSVFERHLALLRRSLRG